MTVHPSWQRLSDSLRDGYHGYYFSPQQVRKIHDFVKALPPGRRVPMLLEAYRVYGRAGHEPESHELHLEKSVSSVLISSLLGSGLRPTERQTCDILRSAFHYCGHGNDVTPPVAFIAQAFQDKPYTPALFEAARAYRETLRVSKSIVAQDAKRELGQVIWHDVSRPDSKCFTKSIQTSIAQMNREEAFAWQWLLRNPFPGFRTRRAKGWFDEAARRIERLQPSRFLTRWNEWLTVPAGIARLTTAGSLILRLLVCNATLFPRDEVSPAAMRLTQIPWKDPEPARKVIDALVVLLAGRPLERNDQQNIRCLKHCSANGEVGWRLTIENPESIG